MLPWKNTPDSVPISQRIFLTILQEQKFGLLNFSSRNKIKDIAWKILIDIFLNKYILSNKL